MRFWTEVKEGLVIAMNAMRANKLRSVLTMLGIFIGIFFVTAIATAIDFINNSFDQSASAFGPEVMYVQKWPWVSNDDWSTMRNRRDIQIEQADLVERQATLLSAVVPVMATGRQLKYNDKEMERAIITGTTAKYMDASGNVGIDGRFFSEEEASGGRPVCVIGAVVAENLFPAEDPIGKTIRVEGHPFTVLGVFEKQGGMFGEFTSDTRVYVPLHAFISYFGGRRWVTIQAKAVSQRSMEDAKIELEGIMRKLRKLAPGTPNDFSINQSDQLTSAFGKISIVFAFIGAFLTGLALFTGGIGIMNIMFVTVTERTKEIGIRKAIGAKRSAILFQFLTEAVTLCIVGSMIGLIVSYIGVLVLGKIFELEVFVPFWVVFIGLAVSVVVGVASGFFPAFRAARMDPVEALRYE